MFCIQHIESGGSLIDNRLVLLLPPLPVPPLLVTLIVLLLLLLLIVLLLLLMFVFAPSVPLLLIMLMLLLLPLLTRFISFCGDTKRARSTVKVCATCPLGIEKWRRLLESTDAVSLLGVSNDTADVARGIRWWLE